MVRGASQQEGAVVYRRLLSYAAPHWKVFLLAALGMVIYAATQTGFAAMMKPLLDGSFVEKDPQTIRLIPVLLISLFLFRGFSSFMSSYAMAWVGRQVVKTLRTEMFARLLHVPTAFYNANPSGMLLAKFTYNVEQVAQASTEAVTVLVRDFVTVVGLLVWMFYLSASLTLVFLVVAPLIAAIVVRVSRRFRRISARIQNSVGNVTQVAQEAIDGHLVVKMFGGQHYEAEQFEQVNEANRRQNMKLLAASAAHTPVIQLLAACALAGVVFIASSEAMLETITVGSAMSFMAATLLLLAPVKHLTSINTQVQKGIAAGFSVFELLDSEPEADPGERPITHAPREIEYRTVSFAYSPDQPLVLRNISLRIKHGQTMAFVGHSGSGKTTLVNLLPRYYDPSCGSILWDGVDLREYRLKDLRNQIALVGQQVVLFNATIAANIAYGPLAKTPVEDIIRVAQAAHAMEFIERLPQGLNTLVGENGVMLSGGQRQRIAIARALLKDAPVLILDEATSALDTQSERYIQAAFNTLMRHRTTLVIAHRLSTVERADLIVVLHQGCIVEMGRHQELLAQGGQYARLYHMQFRDQALVDAAVSNGLN
jgi:lipid A export permease/ATP-binding protein MsbA